MANTRKPHPAQPLPPRDQRMRAEDNHYWIYHGLDRLLACKAPVTASQDEDLFIAVHQICELAFHQMILDLERGLAALDADDPAEAVYFVKRVNRLWRTVNATMPILGGMRAFAEFRTAIGPTSGFQSFQFRHLEIMSGVPRYWDGGTADAEGTPHVAETEFERRYGAEVRGWIARHRKSNLAAHYRRMLARTGGDLAVLRADPDTAALLRELAAYERQQLLFHRAHLQLATRQLEMVGVEVGTGGTAFRDYLQTYDRWVTPLFPGLAEPPPAAETVAG